MIGSDGRRPHRQMWLVRRPDDRSIAVSADDVLALSRAATVGTHKFPGRGPVAPPSTTAAGEHRATAITASHARA